MTQALRIKNALTTLVAELRVTAASLATHRPAGPWDGGECGCMSDAGVVLGARR